MQQVIKRKIELLSPARDLECGIAAIDHGADAVYIGASKFGARAEAGNSMKEIEQLCQYAHFFGARIYLAINTILFDNEIEEAVKIAWEGYNAGVDALIIQDMGLLECNLPPLPLHASTQTNNQTVEKVSFLEKVGFSQVVLARELSLNQIREIRKQTQLSLEFFIHGALCTCFSGQCYLSHYATGRSGNRGECSQMCRHKYTLTDSTGNIIVNDRFLLSLKDLNLSHNIENLIEAGIGSFKIEGRLKGPEYVKNITAYYRKIIDSLIIERSDIERSSYGKSYISFNPNPDKSFNRGFTDYFIKSDKQKIAGIYSPKSQGEAIGTVSESTYGWFIIDTQHSISNGDGMCFFNENNELEGFRVNKTEGKKVFPNPRILISKGTNIFRNLDLQFEQQLEKSKNCRKLEVDMFLSETPSGICLQMIDEQDIEVEVTTDIEKQKAREPEKQNQLIIQQLGKLGDSMYTQRKILISFNSPLFIPSNTINKLRREACDRLTQKRIESYSREERKLIANNTPYFRNEVSYEENISNSKAEAFYRRHGVSKIDKAFELKPKKACQLLMTTKYCIRKELGLCLLDNIGMQNTKNTNLFIEDNTGKYRIDFDCSECQMKIYST